MHTLSNGEIIFNPKTISDDKRLKKYLMQINCAERKEAESSACSFQQNGQEKPCRLLSSHGSYNDKSTFKLHYRYHTFDFLIPGKKENTFNVYTIQLNFHQALIPDGPQKEAWIKQQVAENPGTTDEDFRFEGTYETQLDECVIYTGKEQVFSALRLNNDSQCSVLAQAYDCLKNEPSFKPVKEAFYNLLLPKTERIASAQQSETLSQLRFTHSYTRGE